MTKPTQSMKVEAQKGLDWREEFGRGGTRVGAIRARQIVAGENLSDDTSPDSDLIPETTGINAAFIAPSPKILLKRFGSLKATKKQSEIIPAPIILAINKSLM